MAHKGKDRRRGNYAIIQLDKYWLRELGKGNLNTVKPCPQNNASKYKYLDDI